MKNEAFGDILLQKYLQFDASTRLTLSTECLLVEHVWRSGEGVGFSTSGLSVAEAGGWETVQGHVYQPLDPGVLKNVVLFRLRLKNNIEGEGLDLRTPGLYLFAV